MPDITNQPPPLEPYDLFASDRVLREAVPREQAGWAQADLAVLGRKLGEAATIRLGFEANRNPPVLRAFDRYGHRIDEVDFHPAWHALMAIAVGAGLPARPWAQPRAGAHVARAAGAYMLAQVESGVFCPVAMTYGAVPTLEQNPALAAEWLPRIFSEHHDPRFVPAREKRSALIGMAMTENQGGSDLRTNTTRAEPAGGDGPRRFFRLNGAKWFMSAPMCDAFLVLARSDAGLGCFFVPRWRASGKRNGIHLVRLKDKLGNRSNASSEVELVDAEAELIGEEGRGIPTIIEMSNLTRLDCAIGSAALMRAATAQAIHHAMHRVAFQKKLVDHALRRTCSPISRSKPRQRPRSRCGSRAPTTRTARPPRFGGASSRRQPNSGSASARRRSPPRPWRCSAAAATSRNACCRASIARRRSTRSGRAPAT